jgi:hypothetical protein
VGGEKKTQLSSKSINKRVEILQELRKMASELTVQSERAFQKVCDYRSVRERIRKGELFHKCVTNVLPSSCLNPHEKDSEKFCIHTEIKSTMPVDIEDETAGTISNEQGLL